MRFDIQKPNPGERGNEIVEFALFLSLLTPLLLGTFVVGGGAPPTRGFEESIAL